MNKLHGSILFALTGLLLVSAPAPAEDYRAEAGAWVARVDNEGVDGESFGLQGSYYLRPVVIDDVPLAEAGFLGRADKLQVDGLRYGMNGSEHFDAWSLTSEAYVTAGIPLFLTATVSIGETFEYDADSGERVDGHHTSWQAGIGVTPLDGLRISTRFSQHVDYQPNVDLKLVRRLGGTHWIGVGAELVDPDLGGTYWAVSADYFPDESLRLGAAYNDGYEILWLTAEKFFWTRASLAVEWSRDDFTTALRLRGAWRF